MSIIENLVFQTAGGGCVAPFVILKSMLGECSSKFL